MLSQELSRKLGMPLVVVRPAAIYGPKERRFLKLARAVKSGTFVMFGRGDVRYHFIHVEDLSDAFVRCAEVDEAVGEIFIIADDHAITLDEVARTVADALGTRPPRIRLPYPGLYYASAACEVACKPFSISPPLHRRRAAWFNSTRSFDIAKGAVSWATTRKYVPRTVSRRWCVPTWTPVGCPERRRRRPLAARGRRESIPQRSIPRCLPVSHRAGR